MSLPRWLHSLIQPKLPQTSAPTPPRGEGWGGGPGPTAPSQVELLPTPDHSHRIHIAANDPAFPAKREAAVALICQAVTDIATPLGYTCKGTTWTRTTPKGRTAINLQRSHYGFTATINLRFLTPNGTPPQTGIWAQEEDIGIPHFYLSGEGQENNAITYLDVSDDPTSLDRPMHILKTRALPWLDAHHTATNSPEIADFLPR